MKAFIAFCCLVSMSQAALIAFAPAISQYHSQDPFGQYSYGYSGGPSAKHELRTADGITQGGYSYIDAHNIVQSVNYVSDPVHGFRVAATNLPQAPSGPVAVVPQVAAPIAAVAPIAPQETPEVVAAKIAHFQAHAAARSGVHSLRKRSIAFPVAVGYAAYSPAVVTNHYQTQDTLGQYSYGYNDGLSTKVEARSIDGITTGGYSYLDANGIIQNVQYVADANGFRSAGTNSPVGPAPVAAVTPVVAPVAAVAPVVAPVAAVGPLETPEVVAAKAAHFAAHVEARARLV